MPKRRPLKGLGWERLIPEISAANCAVAHYDGMLRVIPIPDILLSSLSTPGALKERRAR